MRQLLILITLCFALAASATDFPSARRDTTSEVYHGVEVADPYQWLEDWSSAEVKRWSAAQNAAARAVLDGLPMRAAIASEVESVTVGDTVSYYAGQRVGDHAWFMKYAPPRQQPFLVQIDLAARADTEQVVFDPAAGEDGASTSIEWYRVSPDGKLAAIALTSGGAEVADLHVIDLASRKRIDQVVPRVNVATAGGDLGWDADSAGFYYTRYPRTGERPPADQDFYQQLWHRKLGTPLADDRYELGREFDRIAELRIRQHHPSGKVLVNMQHGDSGRFQQYLRDKAGTWHRLSDYGDQLVQAEFIDGDALLALSRAGAPGGKFLVLDISGLPDIPRIPLLAPTDAALASNFYGDPTFIVHHELIYAKVLLGGPEEVRVYDLQGRPRGAPLMDMSGVGQILPWDEGVLIRQSSYLQPNNWLLFDGKTTTRHRLSSTSAVNFDGYKLVREFATSQDGTRIPVSLIMAGDTRRDGDNPLLLTGYGGYAISLSPYFSPVNKVWLDQGGIVAVANLRGGGEYGEQWHRQGMLTRKQNVFDDFHAVMKHLVERGYTSADRLAIEGGSNGGLLMGAMITQHPSDFQAAVSHVGIYDSLRNELSANGTFNIPEYGTVADEEQFRALYAYSPYHRVGKAAYPAVLFMTGENDGRVDPMHSRKMTAALQAATTSGNPVLLRTSGSTGHGSGTPLDENIAQQVDRLAFLFHSLGMVYAAPGSRRGEEVSP